MRSILLRLLGADPSTQMTFTQKLSLRMLWIAAAGGFYVLIDPYYTFTFANGVVFSIGKQGGAFADQMKGAVVTLMLIGGFTAVKEFWLGGSAGEKAQGATLSRIAEAVPVAPAPAAPASITTPRVDVVADNATITGETKP